MPQNSQIHDRTAVSASATSGNKLLDSQLIRQQQEESHSPFEAGDGRTLDLIHQQLDSVRASDIALKNRKDVDNVVYGVERLESLGAGHYTLSKNAAALQDMIQKPDINDM